MKIVLSLNGRPQYRHQSTSILIIGTPKKVLPQLQGKCGFMGVDEGSEFRVTLVFGK